MHGPQCHFSGSWPPPACCASPASTNAECPSASPQLAQVSAPERACYCACQLSCWYHRNSTKLRHTLGCGRDAFSGLQRRPARGLQVPLLCVSGRRSRGSRRAIHAIHTRSLWLLAPGRKSAAGPRQPPCRPSRPDPRPAAAPNGRQLAVGLGQPLNRPRPQLAAPPPGQLAAGSMRGA
jgi:hypothetical protein